jgi:PAS domain S-box-containing protein
MRREDLIGGYLWDLFPAAVGSKFYTEYHRAMETGQPVHFEEYYPDPLNMWLEVHGYPTAEGLTVFFRDITERRQAEEALRVSEERYRALVNASSQVLYRMSPDWSEMRQLQGGSFIADTEEPNRNWLQEYIYPDDQQQLLKLIAKTVRTGKVFELEHRVRRADGTLGWTFSRAVPVRDAAGEIVEWFGAASDITERKQAEEALRESRSQLDAILRNTPAYVYILDASSRYMHVNRAYEELLGLSNEWLKGKSIYEVFPREVASALEANNRKVLESGTRTEFEEPAPLADGVHIYTSIKAPLPDASGRPYAVIGISLDITDRKQAEEDRERLIEELSRSNRDLEQFAYIASHDLQTPLRAVTGFLSLLARRYQGKLGSDADEFIAFAVEGAERMHQLINDILAFSRVGTRGKPFEHVESREPLAQALGYLQGRIKEQQAEVIIGELPIVTGDRNQLAQLFQNLIDNAIKYRKPDEPPRIHIGAEEKENAWEFRISDNGIGFDPQFAERIFQIFQRLHVIGEYSGTGIGLAICKRIVERHGGRIWVESEPGRGSTFYFTLPKT